MSEDGLAQQGFSQVSETGSEGRVAAASFLYIFAVVVDLCTLNFDMLI